MTIDLSGCSRERKAGDQLAHARRRARRLQGADRRRSIRSTKARSARSRSIIPEGNIMMARYPGADGGLEHRSCRRWSTPSSRRWRRRCRTACRPAHHGTARRRGGVLRHRSQDQAALRGAEHRGRRLGRPPQRGRRVGHGVGVPGRRAQRLDRGHRAEMPGDGRAPRAAHRIPAAPASIAAGSASTCACATWSRASGISSTARRRNCPPWGLWGGKPGECGGYLLQQPGENEFKVMVGAHYPVPAELGGDRAHRRRRRLGRSARARSRRQCGRRAGGIHLGAGGARGLRRGAPRRFELDQTATERQRNALRSQRGNAQQGARG